MPQSGIPEHVRKLIIEHINSMDQLEILLLLRSTAPKEWTAEATARELRIDAAAARTRLADLHGRGLVHAEGNPAASYRYGPASADLDRAVQGLATSYAERRVSVINLIFSKPIDHIRVFSDAFRIRKDDDEDG